ncbi:MAG: tetratricopeptide repeat protein [Deltaproteobacteria bacterium]|nr:tetratricopeptide repeat protein [Deltaproteobacteria bacterium]
MRITTLAFAALVGVCVPAVASAQDNTAFAQQRFTRGTALYDARDFPQALVEFRASIELYGSPNTRLYLARCLRELGRLDESVPEFERAMRRPVTAPGSTPATCRPATPRRRSSCRWNPGWAG